MLRRPVFASLLALVLASSAWAKWKPEEQEYLDSHFKSVLDQVQALSKQIQALNARLNELQQTQTQFQEVLAHHQRQLDNLDQMVSTIRLSSEQNFSTLKTMLNQMRAETQKSLSALGGRPTEMSSVGTIATPPGTTPAGNTGYITHVGENDATIDQGSAKGLRVGNKLVVYKANDPNTRAGELEIIEVVDAGTSRARIVSLSSGVKLEFGDIVRWE